MDWRDFRERFAPGRPLVVAHRGVPVVCPENTLASFALALTQGADALETDLRFTADDQIVLHHDATLERTTNGSGAVRSHTLAQLKQLRTRTRDGELTDEPIPTLLDLIEMTGGRTPLLLELKDPLFLEAGHARVLADLLASTGMSGSVALMSFHFEYVQSVALADPTLQIGYISASNPLPRRHARLLGPWWPLLLVNPFYVAWGHRLGSIVAPLDPTPEARIWLYKLLNVDALLADNPATALDAVTRAYAQSA